MLMLMFYKGLLKFDKGLLKEGLLLLLLLLCIIIIITSTREIERE